MAGYTSCTPGAIFFIIFRAYDVVRLTHAHKGGLLLLLERLRDVRAGDTVSIKAGAEHERRKAEWVKHSREGCWKLVDYGDNLPMRPE